jgi:SAM-dependent methyltransferase
MEHTPEYDQRVEQEMRNFQAANFDTWYIQDKGIWYNKAEIDSVVSLLACRKEDVILDAGCGTGRVSTRIAPKIRRLICVDLSIESLLILQNKLPAGLCSKVHCIVADLSKMPIRGCSFSKIVSVQAIQHIPSHEKRLSVLRTLHGLLQKGGHLVFTVFRWNGAVWINKEGYYAEKLYRYAFEADEIKALVKEAGFDEISIQPLIVQHLRLRRFGIWTTYLDRLLARFLNPGRFGQFLLITARKL